MPALIFSKPLQFRLFRNERASAIYWIFLCSASLSIFLFDLYTPLGVAAGTPYVLIIFCSLWFKGNQSTHYAVTLSIVLTIAGFFLSPGQVAPMDVVITNRILALTTILITAFMVLKLKQANHEISSLKTESYIDSLTQCKTDRAFVSELITEIKRSKRYKRNLSIAIFDVDHFTRWIHCDSSNKQESDRLIKNLSSEISNSIRNSDQLYRISHDRFAVIFAETDIHEAKEVSNALREKISKSNHFNNQQGFTVSVGIASLEADDNRRKLYKRAEKALMQAKENGRNQVSTLPEIKRHDRTIVPAILLRSRSH